MTNIKHVEFSLLSVDNVLETIIDELESDKNIVYKIWKDNKIVAVLVPYTEEIVESPRRKRSKK